MRNYLKINLSLSAIAIVTIWIAWSRSLDLGATQDDLVFLSLSESHRSFMENLRGYLWPDYFRPLSSTLYFEVMSNLSNQYLKVSYLGHLINLVFFCASIAVLIFVEMKKSRLHFWPVVVYLIFALTPAMAMPLGWLSGIMDIFWMFLGSILVYLVTKKSAIDKNKFYFSVVIISLLLILTKETGFLLVFSFFAMSVRRTEWFVVKLTLPLITGATFVYLQLNSISSFQPERLLTIYKLFFQSYNLNKTIFSIFILYFLVLFTLTLRSIIRLRITEADEFLIYFTILVQLTFILSGRPPQLAAYYFLPVFWALSILAAKGISHFQVKVKYPTIAVYPLIILVSVAISLVIRSYPIGFASASEFQAKRSMTTYLFLKNATDTTLPLCKPDSSVTAALGNDSFFNLYFPSIAYGDDENCKTHWEQEEWRLK